MHTIGSTHPAPTTGRTRRRLVVLVGGPFPGHRHYRAGLILARAEGAHVLVVAPTLPVAGERWIIDLDAREAQARANVGSWIDALADRAESVRGEIGNESPRRAAADAVDGFAADEYLDALVPGGPSPGERRPFERLRDLLTPVPAAQGLRAANP